MYYSADTFVDNVGMTFLGGTECSIVSVYNNSAGRYDKNRILDSLKELIATACQTRIRHCFSALLKYAVGRVVCFCLRHWRLGWFVSKGEEGRAEYCISGISIGRGLTEAIPLPE
jgi:hypothetical protein